VYIAERERERDGLSIEKIVYIRLTREREQRVEKAKESIASIIPP